MSIYHTAEKQPSPLELSTSHIFCWTPGVSRGTSHLLGERATFQGAPPGVQQKMWDVLSPWGEGGEPSGSGEGSVLFQ
jgi:hypothetical protein